MNPVIAAGRQRFKVYRPGFQTNVLDVASTAGIPMPDFDQRVILNQFYADSENDGTITESDRFAVYGLNDITLFQFALIDWKRGAFRTVVGGMTYTTKGYEGNAVNGYIDPVFNPALNGVKYTQNKAFRLITLYKQYVSGTVLDGIANSSTGNAMYNTATTGHRVNSTTNLSTMFTMTGDGQKVAARVDSTTMLLINKAVSETRPSASAATPNGNQHLLKRGSAFFGDAGIFHDAYGGDITNTIAQNHRVNTNKLLAAFSLPQFA